ncbi:MAG: SH3 domain-containing protein [Anaerolineae bacterium]|nr:SH3 domain-containing protein [Anaerolineae bacterium]
MITVPDDWKVVCAAAYASKEAGQTAVREMILGISPASVEQPETIPSSAELVAVRPKAIKGSPIYVGVNIFSLKAGEAPAEITAEKAAQAGGFQNVKSLKLKGDEAAWNYTMVAEHTLIAMFRVNKAADWLSVTYIYLPNDTVRPLNALVALLLTSTRAPDEPLNVEAWESLEVFVDSLDSALPAFIKLPAGSQQAATLPTATVAATANVLCQVTSVITINVRSGPGTGFPVVGELRADGAVTVIGQAKDRSGEVWWQFKRGWVRNDVVSEYGNCAAVPVVS